MQETKETQETIERSPHDDSGYASSDLYDLLPDAQDQNPQKVSLTTQSLFLRDILREMKKIKSCICKKEKKSVKKMPMRTKPPTGMYTGGRKTRRKRKKRKTRRKKKRRKTKR
jgi:hypothetical protein